MLNVEFEWIIAYVFLGPFLLTQVFAIPSVSVQF